MYDVILNLLGKTTRLLENKKRKTLLRNYHVRCYVCSFCPFQSTLVMETHNMTPAQRAALQVNNIHSHYNPIGLSSGSVKENFVHPFILSLQFCYPVWAFSQFFFWTTFTCTGTFFPVPEQFDNQILSRLIYYINSWLYFITNMQNFPFNITFYWIWEIKLIW